MSRIRPIAMTLLSALLVAAWSARMDAADSRVEAALEAAEAWLELVDQGDYQKSWEEAAEYFRQAVERDQWEKTMKAVRGPLGEVTTRELLEANYRSSLAGAPDGDYVVIRYETSFSKKADSLETITPMLDPDGFWRVSGYYIK